MRHLQDDSWANDIVSTECAKLSEWKPRAAGADTWGSSSKVERVLTISFEYLDSALPKLHI